MNLILKQITTMIEQNCEDCPVFESIRKQHGKEKARQYCKSVCPYGKKLKKLQKELDLGNDAEKALELDHDVYLMHKHEGLTDKEIYKKYKIARNTLARRKKAWGIEPDQAPERKLKDKTKQQYLDLKLQNFWDREIAKMWGVGKNTLMRWKKENNLKGGNEHSFKIDSMGFTKEQYLKHRLEEKTDREIARILGISKSTLGEWKKRQNLRG